MNPTTRQSRRGDATISIRCKGYKRVETPHTLAAGTRTAITITPEKE